MLWAERPAEMAGYDALLTACFGTADPARFERCFVSIHRAALKEGGFEEAKLCVTSATIRASLAQKGFTFPSPAEALDTLNQHGRRRVLVLAIFLSDGAQWDKLQALCAAKKRHFDLLTLTPPLLREQGPAFASVLSSLVPQRKNEAVVMIGHGSTMGENGPYLALKARLCRLGRRDFSLVLLHGSPTYHQLLADLENHCVTKARILFLMLCAGHHAREALQSDGIVAWLQTSGIQTELCPLELGETATVAQLFLQTKAFPNPK